MGRIKNLTISAKMKRFNGKAILASLSAVSIAVTITGCSSNHSSINSVEGWETYNNQGEQFEQLAPTLNPTSVPTPEAIPVVTSTFSKIATEESIARSIRLQNATDPLLEIYHTLYDYVGDEFIDLRGYHCRWVSILGDGYYAYGLLNMDTLTEDIPCNKYKSIGPEFFDLRGVPYRHVSTYGDYGFSYGLFNMYTLKEEIPCNTFKTVEKITVDGNDIFQGTTHGGTVKSYSLTLKK